MTKEEKKRLKEQKREEKARAKAEKASASGKESTFNETVYSVNNKAQFIPSKDFTTSAVEPAAEVAATTAPVAERKPAAPAPQKPVTQKPVEEKKTVTQKPAEEKKPVEEKKTVMEKKPAEKKPAEKKTAEKKPAPASKTAAAAKPAPAKKEDKEQSARPKNYHVSLREDGKWQVKMAKGERALKLFDTQAEAIEFAKEKADNQEGSITVHKRDGKIRKQNY